MSGTDYQIDMSDEQWQLLERLLRMSRLGVRCCRSDE